MPWTDHLLPSPTHIPQLDGDAPEQDDPGPDNPEPTLNHDPDLDPDPVFNSITCKNAREQCSDTMCNFLNYEFTPSSVSLFSPASLKQSKDSKICTNFRKWRKCPKHVHLPTKDFFLSYLIPH